MDSMWQNDFRERMRRFRGANAPKGDHIAVSIKVRITSGCFHRNHSPEAYKLIDESLTKVEKDILFDYIEHETGPEILTWIAGGVALTSAIVSLVTAIINARAKGIKKGDTPKDPLQLIIRTTVKDGEYHEEIILTVGPEKPVTKKLIEKSLNESTKKITKKSKKRN